MANTTILLRIGFRNFAIPYSDKRAAALADLITAATRVDVDYHGRMTDVQTEDPEDFTFYVLRQDIPEITVTEENEEN